MTQPTQDNLQRELNDKEIMNELFGHGPYTDEVSLFRKDGKFINLSPDFIGKCFENVYTTGKTKGRQKMAKEILKDLER